MHMWSTKKIQAFRLENIRAAYSNEKQMDTNDSIQTNASSPRSDSLNKTPTIIYYADTWKRFAVAANLVE